MADVSHLFASGVVALWIASAAGGAVIKEDYGSRNVFGYTTSGVYDYSDPYTVGTTNWQARLIPARPTEINNTNGNFFFTTLANWAQGSNWTFNSAVNTLSNDSLVVRTYNADGAAARVGAEFHVEYVPGPGDPTANVHWIQVVRDNHKLGTGGGHGVPELIVDNGASPGNRSPYYDDGGAADGRNFYDRPWRDDGGASHLWEAELFLVTGPAPNNAGLVTLYRTGISWGWENVPTPGSLAIVALAGLVAPRRRR